MPDAVHDAAEALVFLPQIGKLSFSVCKIHVFPPPASRSNCDIIMLHILVRDHAEAKMRASPHRQPHKMPRISFPGSIDWMPKGKRKTNYTPRPVSAQASCGKTPPYYAPFRFPARRLHTRSAVVVINTHKTAIAQPLDTLPCSNSRLIYVETTKVFGGAMRLAVTSSRKAMMKIIIARQKCRARSSEA